MSNGSSRRTQAEAPAASRTDGGAEASPDETPKREDSVTPRHSPSGERGRVRRRTRRPGRTSAGSSGSMGNGEVPLPPRVPSIPVPDPDDGGQEGSHSVSSRTGRVSSPRPSTPPRPSAPPSRRSIRPQPRRLLLASGDEPGEEALWGPAFPEQAWSDRASLVNVALVRCLHDHRPLECDVGDQAVAKGDTIVIETERGLELALVVSPGRRKLLEGRTPARMLRRATEADLAAEARLRVREAEVVRMAREAVQSLGLPAKVVRAEIGLGGGRASVYIASEDRVDLRELARRLSAQWRGRVELRHVGMRDAARMIGGIGPCGLQLCCNTFLSDFAPVSIRMAKDQGLALNPQRISGMCGRLMCCLVYEEAFYRAQRALFPKHGKRVDTPRGPGVVRDVDVLSRTVRVAFGDGTVETFSVEDIRTIQGGAGSPSTGTEPVT